MESLLCNEVWLMNPLLAQEDADDFHAKNHAVHVNSCFYSSKPDFEEVVGIFLEKESSYMPDIGYSKLLNSSSLISTARFTAVSSLLKSQRRMNLSPGTVFNAVNYLDRFISMTRECQVNIYWFFFSKFANSSLVYAIQKILQGWKSWKFELLSTACLSVASKLNESTTFPLHEFQMENSQQDSFSPGLIQQMELTLLKTLAWRMDCSTPFSYIELMICSIDSLNKTRLDDLISRVTQLLLDAVIDYKFLEFRSSVIAMSAVRCIYENNASITPLNTMIPQKHMDDLIRCQKMMEKLWFKDHHSGNSLSPVTVLKVELYNCYDYRVDLSLLKMPRVNIIRKRKREEAA
ncbi:putative cyclin-D7-1 isoform X1 [Primulina tabacum]|uniref:putative cyclin-D7-1 isoform X1 n=1 Tax=Primulina tabacum TaxID=48773 RepID=UPI003F5A5BA0